MIGRLTGWLGKGGAGGPSSAVGHVPVGMRVYAIGDVHGRVDLLADLLGKIKADALGFNGKVVLVGIGDFIDRGPQSAEVVDLLLGLSEDWEKVFLRGNHEHAMLEFLNDPKGRPMWLSWGGVQALESYGVQPFGARGLRDADALAAEMQHALVERGHGEFYHNTVLQRVIGGYAFVHAGVRAGISLKDQMVDDLLFIREDFVGRPHGLPYRIVFGHTIFDQPLLESDRIGVDTGAYASGVLTAVVLEGVEVKFMQAVGDKG